MKSKIINSVNLKLFKSQVKLYFVSEMEARRLQSRWIVKSGLSSDECAELLCFSTTTFKLRASESVPCSGSKTCRYCSPTSSRSTCSCVVPFPLAANADLHTFHLNPQLWYAKIDSVYDHLVLKVPRNHARLTFRRLASLVRIGRACWCKTASTFGLYNNDSTYVH